MKVSADLIERGPLDHERPAAANDVASRLVVDPEMVRISALLKRVAPTHLTVLILGETGVGKEVAAEWIHRHGARPHAPFLKINSAGLSESIIESELFGHEKGAFSGAIATRPGIFEAADGGMLFLDEVGELSPRVQAKLLRVLECGEIVRVGGTRPLRVDVRVVSATHRDLKSLVQRGEFRDDLFFRLSGLTVKIPPLRAREIEIRPLAEHFIARCCRVLGKPPLALGAEAAAALLRYPWPGNVRELKHAVERAVVMCSGATIQLADLALEHVAASPVPAIDALPPASSPGIRDEVRSFEKERIEFALAHTGGNQTQAATLLGVSRRTLTNKLNAHGIERPRKSVGSGQHRAVGRRDS